ncbi:MAG: dihydroorotate dehydrogenase [Chloroflexota bacterium]|nr:dihydroorotate dehydrogenase [Dehalococcoidia bacterium]MDW8254855.1 dihydroorotate dehydrogenase [Chloroflexota bacterium]
MVNLAVDLTPRLRLANPVIAASGTFGYGTEYEDLIDRERLGAIVSKAVGPAPRHGNPLPRLFETPAGLLNSIGLQGIGVERVAAEKAPLWARWRVPVIVNVVGERVGDFCAVVERLDGLPGVAGFELNISCPNVEGGMLFGHDARMAAELTAAVRRRTQLPLLVKLSPNAPDPLAVAQATVAAGADCLVVANTWLGMAIDPKRRRPVFSNVFAGLSGPAIRPLAVRLTYQVAQVVNVPIVGCGGIASAADALEFIMAGATAVQVGTMTFTEPGTMVAVIEGLRDFCEREGVTTLTELVGAANDRCTPEGAA